MYRICIALVVGLLLATTCFAEEPRLKDQAEIAFVSTSGNSEVTTLAAKNTLTYAFSERFLVKWKLLALYSESDGETEAESYATQLRGDYLHTDRLYSYASVGWLKDRFAGLEARYTLIGGAGYKFLLGPKHFLAGEAGLTYTTEKLKDDADRGYLGVRLFGQYDYVFSETSRFSQSVEWLTDFDETENWLLISETALVTALNSHLSLKTSYVVNYDNLPADDFDETDTVLGVTLVVNF
ncbi:MAG: hypothetical protein C0617_06255 [Desulfuromonas sp.]|uniref:DUF481 domain-containing protein n=1 Tax=Desulfuromonas sp. TaxID=892 RepID=UPI000CAF855D|nr:DUF481 domain-containing protein [Desulfuromonas sp.]PLX84942.1 MAG: hypothetical protein C0617_06255 [Desulfuromonas sp.]